MKIIIEFWGKKIIIKYVKIYLLSYTCIDSPESKTTSFPLACSREWLCKCVEIYLLYYIFTYLIMIDVMRLDGKKYWVNPHMIESMESTPDLTLTMLSGRKIIVRNSPEDIIEKIIKYRRDIGIERQEVL